MINAFFAILGQLIGPIVRKVLVALGFGIISYAAVKATVDSLIDSAKSNFDALPSSVIAYVSLIGIGDCLGIIAGAISIRLGLQFAEKIGRLPS